MRRRGDPLKKKKMLSICKKWLWKRKNNFPDFFLQVDEQEGSRAATGYMA